MKKLIMIMLFVPLLAVAYADNANIKSKNDTKAERTINRIEAKKLVSRLHEIKDIAKTQNLNSYEKNQLRTEVQNIKERLEKMGGVYLYLSVTTIIIILLLIILL